MANKKLLKKVLGKKAEENMKPCDIKELAKPKDKWKRGDKMKELAKVFPHDLVL